VKAHGTAVGLPSDDDMGNSEVGHNALGAGRIFAQGYADIFVLEIYSLLSFNYFDARFDPVVKRGT
jgi:2,3-bisphosphoglycerate-independent phosphoglycerate mutase